MSEKSKVMFLTLVICGTLCILGALGTIGYLYLQNALQLALPDTPGTIPKTVTFFCFVGIPSAIAGAAGIGMIVVGIRTAMNDGSSP
jgi:hypothetical protein